MAGQRVGDFEVVRWLGRGGFADVYEARQLLVERPAALKVLVSDQRPSDEQLNEARLLARLSHPSIVQIFGAGYHLDPATNKSWLYLATELLKGGTLRDRLTSSERLPMHDAVRIAVAMCEALAYSHAQGIVHRDVKPENVLLTEGGTPKLADFGVSRLLSEGQVASSVVGTAPYIAPEGWEGATHQSDIWAVGALLYEMLSGSPPFSGRTPAEVERRIKQDSPRPLRESVPGIPSGVEAAVHRALQKQPGRRFARASDFAEALRPYLAGQPQGSTEASTQTGTKPSTMQAVRTTTRRVVAFVARQAVGTIVFLVVAGLIGYLGMALRHGPSKPAEPRVGGRGPVQPTALPGRASARGTKRDDKGVGMRPSGRTTASTARTSKTTAAAPDKAAASAGAGGSRGAFGAKMADPPRTEDAQDLYLRAKEKLKAGERDQAMSLLRTAIRTDPKHAGAHMQLAILYGDAGDMRAAISELGAVVRLQPSKVGGRVMLARAYEQDGQAGKAVEQWRKVLALDPRNAEAKRAVDKATNRAD